ncbi:hypothetical protein [Haliangium ochraceum]|uniref:Peptidase M10 metallopeptidase domain-containing protein n=1 Tax=Haliangium ochraceum (strain DSM 14365 / JCM 11303 / SMP-2) TaxID=502025 RepID=D0LVZ8_HALO1|nr:hypothetical protein [Haliangium ochraceum]ACY14132.1 hypothetical protein Hoch_1581 [Haliangium ochraceum DSM 14365]
MSRQPRQPWKPIWPAPVVALVLCAAVLGLGAGPATAETIHVEIRPMVAVADGTPVVDRAWLLAQVERANAIFAGYELQFVLGPSGTFDAPVEAQDRPDRNALARHVAPKVLNLFVVGKLMDIHEAGVIRRGVHWKAEHRGERVHYVILAAYAETGILAHELAHFFGNPKHRHEPGNLVGYVPGEGLPRLDPDQQQRMRRALRRMLRSGELARRPAPADAAAPGSAPAPKTP